jgi:hypothetical protein
MVKQFIYISLVVILISCKQEAQYETDFHVQNSLRTELGLQPINDSWEIDTIEYYIEYHSGKRKYLPQKVDTAEGKYVTMRKTLINNVSDSLMIVKSIITSSKESGIISESDSYYRKIPSNLQSFLMLEYNFQGQKYLAEIDTIATEEKYLTNKIKLDSMLQYAEENDLYICGTGVSEILSEGIPLSPSVEISKNEAIVLIRNLME